MIFFEPLGPAERHSVGIKPAIFADDVTWSGRHLIVTADVSMLGFISSAVRHRCELLLIFLDKSPLTIFTTARYLRRRCTRIFDAASRMMSTDWVITISANHESAANK